MLEDKYSELCVLYKKCIFQHEWDSEHAILLKHNLGGFFRHVNANLSSKCSVPVLNDPVTGSKIVDSFSKAQLMVMNRVFVSHCVTDNRTLPHVRSKVNCTEPMRDVVFHRLDILHIILGLQAKCSAGPDGIPSLLIKKMAHCLSLPLTMFFSLTYACGSMPTIWKQATVIPRYEEGQKSDPENYRPISLTCVAGKVFETILKSNILTHLKSVQFFTPEQHGFLPGSSTTTN